MFDWEKLLEQAAEKAKAAQAIYSGDKPDADALKTADALMVEAEALQKRAESLKAAQAITDQVEAAKAARVAAENEPAANAGKAGFLTGGDPEEGEAPYSLGEMLRDTACYYTGKGLTPQLGAYHDRAQKAVIGKAVSGMSEGVPTEGGFLLRPEHSDALMQKTYNTGQILQRVTRNQMSAGTSSIVVNRIKETSRATGSRYGGVRVYWAAEGDTITASKVQLERKRWEPHKLMALCYATDELVADAAALESIINDAFPKEMSFVIEDSIFRGTGAGQPLGIFPADVAGDVVVSVAKQSGQSADTIVKENVDKMWARMWAASRASAIWLINQDCEPQLDSMSAAVGTGGIPVYLPPGGLSETPFSRLKGRQVIPVEYCNTVGDLGDIVLFDPGEYQLWDKGGLQSAVSLHVRFIYDEMTYRWTYRVDGGPKWSEALTPYKSTDTLSPFVALAERA